ncbi:proline-rich receptor-like protein kinase PERK9 [Anoplophora glabripennis]|uniref:proline-rich receptor-like protein kinase PERK9 n=1 Tax=Anoplophora glabripennis TaxID=217634 RepID=UPI000873A209|nr:proline-rich receptor-like protein kinase PERK9 [Anoplophora glabripennis]
MEPSPYLPGTPPQVPLRLSLLDSEVSFHNYQHQGPPSQPGPPTPQRSTPSTVELLQALNLAIQAQRNTSTRPAPSQPAAGPSQTSERAPAQPPRQDAPPGNPVNDDVFSDEEDEMPPPEAAEAEDQYLDDLHPGQPIEPVAPQVGAQDEDGPHLDRPTEPRLPYTEAQDQDGLHPGRLIKPTSQPGRQPTDHGRVQRLDDDRPPYPLIAYPEATPGPSHARPHANLRASHHL